MCLFETFDLPQAPVRDSGELAGCSPCRIADFAKELDKENIGSSLELEQWFKIDISVDRTKATSPVVVSTLARDPKCRMM